MPDLAPGLGKSRVEKRLAEAAEEPTPDAESGSARIRPPLAVAPFNEKTAKQYQARWAKYLRAPTVQANSIGMKLALIPPGEFDMGSPKELIEEELRRPGIEEWYREHLPGEAPQHRVRITKPFWLGVTDVTQQEYQRVMGSNPSKFPGDPNRPVEQVTWNDAVEFCRRLSELPGEKAAKRRYGLPTEAQWEYACRAGSTGRFNFSSGRNAAPKEYEENALADYGWFEKNSGEMTHAVGGKRPNAWGLFDMCGNVWELCQDWYGPDYYAKSPLNDPAGPTGGSVRVCRGGGWATRPWSCRSACRFDYPPDHGRQFLGFRVCHLIFVKGQLP
jgi:formylglycine-generating enzyme required for sulfatase activity